MISLSSIRSALGHPSLSVLARNERVMLTARTLVEYYYYVLPFAALIFLTGNSLHDSNFEPFWPIGWVDSFGLGFYSAAFLIKTFFCVTAICAIFFHRSRLMRLFVFLAIVQVHALESSFGAVDHQWYALFYTSLIFVFLPDIWRQDSYERSRMFLLLIWFAQASIAFFYSLAGLHKFLSVAQQFAAGEIHGFSPMAFPYLIADWVPQLQNEALAASFVIEHPYLVWIPFMSVPFFQFFSLWVMVRTRLQKIWAAMVLLLYVGIALTMGISFLPLVLVVIVLFFNSPFAAPYGSWREFVGDLPIIGQVYEYAMRRVS